MPTKLPLPLSRRVFCVVSGAALFTRRPRSFAQTASLFGSVRPDVASIDHDRILAAAAHALTQRPTPLTSLPAPASPGTAHDFYSEAEGIQPGPASFSAHRDAIFNLSRQVAALAAAFQITHEDKYAAHAKLHLDAWFVDPSSRMTPNLLYGHVAAPNAPTERKPSFESILETVFLAEVAQAITVLAALKAWSVDDRSGLKTWFAAYLQWLNESRLAGLARDQKDHHGSSWLLQTASFARLTGNDTVLSELRHRFKTVTLRAQIVADGTFPHELSTANPFRNSLFNLDLLAAACDQLSSRFESLWDVELQDGPGLHMAMAKHFPYIQDRRSWPYRADLTHFTDLPVRNPSLLFAARVYNRPEYAELWKTLNPDPAVPEIERSFPISQPLLWVNRPRV